jgi:hypothetical protein
MIVYPMGMEAPAELEAHLADKARARRRRDQEIRRGSTAARHRNKTRYHRASAKRCAMREAVSR